MIDAAKLDEIERRFFAVVPEARAGVIDRATVRDLLDAAREAIAMREQLERERAVSTRLDSIVARQGDTIATLRAAIEAHNERCVKRCQGNDADGYCASQFLTRERPQCLKCPRLGMIDLPDTKEPGA